MEEKNANAVLAGLSRRNGEVGIGLALVSGPSMAAVMLTVDSAAVLFNQLGDLLDELGYFDEQEEESEAPCVRH